MPVATQPTSQALALLHRLTNDPASAFRGDQWQVIDAIANRRERVLLVQRTGWGKSAVYFISAKLLRDQGYGPTLIVSPLLGLMRNQVHAGRRMGLRVGALHSGTNDRFDVFVDMVRKNAIDALLVSPERFANERFQADLLPLFRDRLGLLVVDEAHCISDWGHDFRPDYQRLANQIAALPADTPILATTATANDRVVADVSEQLGALHISRGNLHRENLALQTFPTTSQGERFAWLAQTIPTLPGRGIVYTLTTGDAEEIAAWLAMNGIDTHAYHGQIGRGDGQDSENARRELEQRFTDGDIRVLVATSALGMGYDNPDVRFVIHYQMPGSIIAYYQQVGRAGRGKDGAVGILMSGPEDDRIHDFFRTSSLPSPDDVRAIHAALASHPRSTVTQLMGTVNLRRGRLEQALGYLAVQTPPTIRRVGREWERTDAPEDPGYAARRDALIRQRITEQEEMIAYRKATGGCRMHILLTALDDPEPVEQCGICDLCRGEPVVPVAVDPAIAAEAARYLGRPTVHPIEPRKQFPAGAFEIWTMPTRIPANPQAETGAYLAAWHERDDLRQLVQQGKRSGRFDDRLVTESVRLIRETWQPQPSPMWVTAVPSLRSGPLVPDLARRIADGLGLPYADAITQVRETEPQRAQENSVHQCRNLDGAFEVSDDLPAGPVLLVDDFVDSKWTLAVLSYRLREAGSGPVLPFALVSTANRDD